MHHLILGIGKLVNIGHEVGDGVGVSFVILLEELEVGYPLLVVGYHVFILDTCESVAILRTMCGSRTGGWSLPCVMSD
jgi:hypothetical protein